MHDPERESAHQRSSEKITTALNVLIALAIVFLFSWLAMPAPKFQGLTGGMCVAYFVVLFSIFALSFYWIVRFGSDPAAEEIPNSTKRSVTPIMVISIVVGALSFFFVLFAMAVGGLFQMI